jgi:hypothetical protein
MIHWESMIGIASIAPAVRWGVARRQPSYSPAETRRLFFIALYFEVIVFTETALLEAFSINGPVPLVLTFLLSLYVVRRFM